MSLIKSQARVIVEKRIAEVVEIAKTLYPEMAGFKYTFKECTGRCAGIASYTNKGWGDTEYTIKININLMVQGMKEWNHIFHNTIPHEIAHLVDYVTRGKSNHDRVWERIAKSLGCDGVSRHSLPVAGRGRVVYMVPGYGKVTVTNSTHMVIQGKNYDKPFTCGGGAFEIKKEHLLSGTVMDSIPDGYDHYLEGETIIAKKESKVMAPSGIMMRAPTKKAIKIWESGSNRWGSFNRDYGKGRLETVENQYKLCRMWFGK
ncbi:hypothetical protein AP1_0286 [Aeromonas phage AP1]|nr:hypothetical protein AP1_0286 [Aeromonas phage AP1]